MAYTKPTLATLKQSLADRHNSGTVPTKAATLAMWVRIFNRAAAYCIRKLKYTKSTDLTTSSGTIALPDDFLEVHSVYLDGTEVAKIAPNDEANRNGNVYWISGDFASGFYFNAPDDTTYTIKYIYIPSPMASDSDTCPFPDEEAIVAYAYGMIRKAESDPFQDADAALAECDNRLKEIRDNQAMNDNFTGFNIQYGA